MPKNDNLHDLDTSYETRLAVPKNTTAEASTYSFTALNASMSESIEL
jgi:hypothetical protein